MKGLKKRRILCAVVACMLAAGAAAEQRFGVFSFENVFEKTGVQQTETAYRSPNLSVEIEALREYQSDVYVADMYLRSAESLRRAFGGEGWDDASEKLDALARKSGAVLAFTGDNGHHLKAGWEVGNGELLRSRGNNVRDLCVLYTDGVMETYRAPVDHERLEAEMAQGRLWQSFVFGPALLDEEGHAILDFPASDVSPENPRAVIGYYEPGHYCLVQVDGRGTASALEPQTANRGMTLAELAQFMESLGCRRAYNLDGGQTAAMWFDGAIISTPYHNGRAMGDAIVLCEPGELPDTWEDFLVE